MTDGNEWQTPPTISIYQNPNHVSGILQQALNSGLLTGEQLERAHDLSTGRKRGKQGGAGLDVGAAVPGLGKGSLQLDGRFSGEDAEDHKDSTRSSQNYVFSEAYYLYHVRQILVERGQLKQVGDRVGAGKLKPGDFVEFEATFQPNELSALLDILTPEMVKATVYHHFRQGDIQLFEGYSSFEDLQKFSLKSIEKAQAHADLAHAVTAAVGVDFRSEKTREYYGSIGSANAVVTAMTICDAAHFIVDDEDRILDGHFKVLGKVTSPVVENVSVLERNKLLNRLNPVVVDEVFTKLRKVASDQAVQLEELAMSRQSSGSADDEEVDEPVSSAQPFDLALTSRIAGPSFRVIPIAIYI